MGIFLRYKVSTDNKKKPKTCHLQKNDISKQAIIALCIVRHHMTSLTREKPFEKHLNNATPFLPAQLIVLLALSHC